LLLEDVGDGEVRGSLYSLDARDEMLDLGSEYKYFGLAFTERSEILVAREAQFELTRLWSFETLLQNANTALSPACNPPSPGDYRK
jgi:hypothetical protein